MSDHRAVSSQFSHAAIFRFESQDAVMETKAHSVYPNLSVAKRDSRSVRKGIFHKEGE
jgi:hypothetical protein